MKLIRRFAYPAPTRLEGRIPDDGDGDAEAAAPRPRPAKLHALRDADAGMYYVAKLAAKGYGFDLEINAQVPPGAKAARAVKASERVKKGDVLLISTRPPLTPDSGRLLAPIVPSGSWIEEHIVETLSRVFRICCREEVVLSSAIARQLPKEAAEHAKLKFQLRPPAYFKYRARHQQKYGARLHGSKTAGYLISAREIWPNGPDLFCSFGMSGPMNLAWAYLLATKHPELIRCGDDRFVMADILPRKLPGEKHAVFPEAAESLEFADSWQVRILLDTALPPMQVPSAS
ncbi:MAG: hypothetical protein NTY38_24825 [Acidobacteria bacterium]|nr:hypothetical protein [Acidobacteriota bacterium]